MIATPCTRHAKVAVICVFAAVFCVSASRPVWAAYGEPLSESCPRAGNPAVRSDDAYTQRLIELGMERSPTFAALVDALEETDLVVIVDSDPKLSQQLNGYLVFLSSTSACRYVRVKVTTRVSRMRAVPILGHELQHALEVALHPEVVDAASLRAMYERIGMRSNSENSFESNDAARAGQLITLEMFSPAAAAAAAAQNNDK